MSKRLRPTRLRRSAVAIAAALAVGVVPAAAQAAPVNLATVGPFAVLGGSTVTNTGPSVLNGGLGVAPGTALTGFSAPAVVNGAIHENTALASQAQADLANAFGVAGGQAVSPGNELTGQNLGGLTLTAGAYGFSSSAQLTGQLTLDAQGDPNAEFVFIVGSTLTTESASSIILTNGASPCNVYWRIGSSATLGTGTQFIGNLMALTDITLNDAVHVDGRVLARNGQVSLINDVIDNSKCSKSTETPTTPGETPTTPTVTPTTPGETTSPGSTTPTPVSPAGTATPVGSRPTKANPAGSGGAGNKKDRSAPARNGSSTVTHGPQGPNGTAVTVTGKKIAKVVVRVDNKTVETSRAPSLRMNVNGTPGTHTVTVHVTYKDHTVGKTTTFRIHVPSPAPLQPHPGPSRFTG